MSRTLKVNGYHEKFADFVLLPVNEEARDMTCSFVLFCFVLFFSFRFHPIIIHYASELKYFSDGEKTSGGSKLSNRLGRTKLANSLGKQQLELSTRT